MTEPDVILRNRAIAAAICAFVAGMFLGFTLAAWVALR